MMKIMMIMRNTKMNSISDILFSVRILGVVIWV